MSEELGKAHVKITADTTDLNAKVDAAKAKVESFAGSAKNETDALWESMKKGSGEATVAVEAQTAAVGGLSVAWSALASFGATALIAVLVKIISLWKEAEEAAKATAEANRKAFDEAIRAGNAAQDALTAMAEPSSQMSREIQAAGEVAEKAIDKIREKQKAFSNKRYLSAYNELESEIARIETQKQETQKAIADRYSEEGEKKLRQQFARRADDAVAADEKMYADFARNAQKLADDEDRDRAKQAKHAEEMQKAAERLNTTRVQGILDQEKALQRMYEAQSRGFGNNDGSSSIQGGFDMLAREIQAGFSRMGNGA